MYLSDVLVACSHSHVPDGAMLPGLLSGACLLPRLWSFRLCAPLSGPTKAAVSSDSRTLASRSMQRPLCSMVASNVKDLPQTRTLCFCTQTCCAGACSFCVTTIAAWNVRRYWRWRSFYKRQFFVNVWNAFQTTFSTAFSVLTIHLYYGNFVVTPENRGECV